MLSKYGWFRTLLSNRLHCLHQPCNSPNRPRNNAKRSEVGRTHFEMPAGIFRAGIHGFSRTIRSAYVSRTWGAP